MRGFKLVLFTLGILAAIIASGHAAMLKIPAELAPLAETHAAHPGAIARVAVTVKLPQGYHMQSNRPRDPLLVPTALTLTPPAGVTVLEAVYPRTIEFRQEDVELPLVVFEREFTIGLALKLDATVPPGDLTIPAVLKYQPCDESMCYPPNTSTLNLVLKVVPPATPLVPQHPGIFAAIAFGQGTAPATAPAPAPPPATNQTIAATDLTVLDRFTVSATAGGYMNAEKFTTFIHHAEAGVKERGMFEGRGPLVVVLLVLLGGFMLNLTPCVLPMIPINLAIIGAGAQAGSARRGFMLGATYGAAMALVYGIIGLGVILTAGTFGTLNASPWFNFAIAILFVVLGLAMFDVFTIDLSKWSGNFNPKARSGSFVLAFSMGAVAALLAGACVAPVVIQVILYASSLYNSGTRIALALPFFLGLGMAIPWPFAGAGLSALPKPGMWMTRVKQAFGVLIIAMALYYGYLGYEILSARSGRAAPAAAAGEHGWITSLPDGLAQAEREHKPVIIDFWASWCKNCMTMDQTTLKNPEVNAALEKYIKIRVQAESPDAEPAKSLMQRFQAVGLPTYVILKPGAR